ncbi:unnamed protein product [Pleuronectes platessa]|uniref:Uncharacterized protein n=1 Tax=Pleuronectes platessa TaxID=8262 RepID=A0A9N7ZFZ4_PLEPL|nr:unnamed protein product [Pleuronectes platessa]
MSVLIGLLLTRRASCPPERQFEVQHLAQGHFGMQMGKTGIKLPTFCSEEDCNIPQITSTEAVQHITGNRVLPFRDIYHQWCRQKARSIIKDHSTQTALSNTIWQTVQEQGCTHHPT